MASYERSKPGDAGKGCRKFWTDESSLSGASTPADDQGAAADGKMWAARASFQLVNMRRDGSCQFHAMNYADKKLNGTGESRNPLLETRVTDSGPHSRPINPPLNERNRKRELYFCS